MKRRALAATVAGCVALMTAASAHASFHDIKISEFYGGSSANAHDDSFIELQMYSPGQNSVNNMAVRFYTTAGASQTDIPLVGNAGSGENQRTILIGDTAVPGGVDYAVNLSTYDLTDAAACYIDPVLGAHFDCISWGAFAGGAGFTGSPFFMGTPEPGLPFNASSITRQIGANCATALDAADDTNDSASDFALAAPSPRRNTVAPTETLCTSPPPGGGDGGSAADTTPPETTINSGPQPKTKSKSASFGFSSSEQGSTFQCSLDDGPFEPCSSPEDVKVKKGKHTFEVRATDAAGNTDPTPATQSWTVKKKKKKK